MYKVFCDTVDSNSTSHTTSKHDFPPERAQANWNRIVHTTTTNTIALSWFLSDVPHPVGSILRERLHRVQHQASSQRLPHLVRRFPSPGTTRSCRQWTAIDCGVLGPATDQLARVSSKPLALHRRDISGASACQDGEHPPTASGISVDRNGREWTTATICAAARDDCVVGLLTAG